MDTRSIVNILGHDNESVGTGFFVSSGGYILTCWHVLKEAGYANLGQVVNYKYEGNDNIFKSEWINGEEKYDIAILHSSEKIKHYISMCERKDIIESKVDSYGFPNGSYDIIKAICRIDRLIEHDESIQLGNSNEITFGFSGAPIIYNDTAIGIIKSVTKTDSNERLQNISFGTSSKPILELFPKYISKKEVCIGYGEKEEKCSNYAISKSEGLCEECYKMQFVNTVKSFYKVQNYQTQNNNDFFIAKLKYGFTEYCDIVFPLIKFSGNISVDDLIEIEDKVDEKYKSLNITIVTNAIVDENANKYAHKNHISIKSKEDLLRNMFDFGSYRKDLLTHVESEQLSTHYIDIYSIDSFKLNEEMLESYDDFDDDFDDDFYDDNENKRNVGISHKILLNQYVDNFLKESHKALLILGDYGSGKTSFCYTYTLELLNKFISGKSTFLPILIKMRGYNKAVNICELLTSYFVNDLGLSNFNISSFKLLLKNINVVLIFDGYDEVAKKVDFDVKYDVLKEICQLAEDNTKIIITCRPNYFQNESEFKRIFQNSHFPYEPGDKPFPEFIETSIAELDDRQINAYIKSYQTELDESNTSVSEMLTTIANTHDLTDLSKRPFLLYMILSTLPKILKDEKDKGHNKINASSLYSVYTDNWIKREDSKNKTLIKKEDKELFCKELAFELYKLNTESLSYKALPETIKNYFKDLERIEDIDYFTHDIQSCSFLTSDRTGNFKFVHKSFMEYFVADWIVNKILECINKSTYISEINSIIGETYLSMEVCLFINDILDIKDRDLIKNITTYFEDYVDKAKANLLSIIAKSKMNMSTMLLNYTIPDECISNIDFSHATFVGGTFKNLVFNNVQFYMTTFNNITFVNCNFEGIVYNKASLENVRFKNCNFRSSEWTDTKLQDCEFTYNDTYAPLDFDHCSLCIFLGSSWKESQINDCKFEFCDFSENIMSSMTITDSIFQDVDFSGTLVRDELYFNNNNLIDVSGEPYEFG